MKNELRIKDDLVYITLPNTSPVSHATGSLVDLPLIQQHRWRFIAGRVVTTVQEANGHAIVMPYANIVLGRDRRETVPHKDTNALNCTAANFAVPRYRGTPNAITIAGDVAYIDLKHDRRAIIDTADVSACLPFVWLYVPKSRVDGTRNECIRATYRIDKGKKTNILLPRFLLDLPNDPGVIVKHRNGDMLDCRRANLTVTRRRKPSITDQVASRRDASAWFTASDPQPRPKVKPPRSKGSITENEP